VLNRDQPKDPEIGATLVTSIDKDLQLAVEQSLAAKIGDSGKAGGAVVLDVKTGRVLAMASHPTYHPDVWTNGITKPDYRKLAKSGALLDQALQGTYAPGSTFKPITALAMRRSGEGLNDIYACPSAINVGGHAFSNYGGSSHGPITLATALRVSCNTVFYRAAEKLWQDGGGERKSKTEYDPIANAAKDVGLGKDSGIDLPGEAKGIVASPTAKYALWKNRKDVWCAGAKSGYTKLAKTKPGLARDFTALDTDNCNSGKMWRQGDAMNAGVGQGTTAVSPLQMAAAYATLLGDGRRRDPTVGRALVWPNGKIKKIKAKQSKVVVDTTMRKFLRSALSGVTTQGTAAGVFADFPLDKYQIMGKTGTAQVDGKEDTSWFMSAAPAEDPQYVIAVTVARGGTGGETSAPITKRIYEAIYGIGRPAVMPADGPDYDIPRVKPLLNPKISEKDKVAAREKAKAKEKAKALLIKEEAQVRAQARTAAKKTRRKAAQIKAKAKAAKARAKVATTRAKAKSQVAKSKISDANKKAKAAQKKASAAAEQALAAAEAAKTAKKAARGFTQDKMANKKAKKRAEQATKGRSIEQKSSAKSAVTLPDSGPR
jgi:penicillin-binding protein 2